MLQEYTVVELARMSLPKLTATSSILLVAS